MKTDIILPTDDRTITKVETRQVWASANGKFYLTEESARFNGATHLPCKCGQPKEKNRVYCDACEPKEEDKYTKMPFREWDRKTPLVIFQSDEFFYDEESIHEYAEDHEMKVSDLKLVICDPNYLREIEIDYWEDVWPEEVEHLPKEVEDALKTFNEVLKKQKPFSWTEGNYRTSIKEND